MENIISILRKIGEIDPQKLEDADLLNFVVSLSSFLVAALSLVISLILLVYTVYQYFLKSGDKFYGAFAVSSSVWSKQSYISEIILENSKDKVSVIGTIYLRIGNNIYLELVDYADSPRLVGPFETVKLTLREGVSGYISSSYKVDIGEMLRDRKIKKTLMIATPKGVFKVKKYKRIWNVYVESLRNHFIIPVRPVRKYHNGSEFSDALQYVVECSDGDKNFETLLYRECSHEVGGFTVRTDDFATAADLEKFLIENLGARNLRVKSVGYSFHDFESYKNKEVFRLGFWGTNVVGKIYTKFLSVIFRLKNSRRR
ncbi:hypothetical protein [Pseudomonas fulva]|uniref:hypothetical protein n=1 Tax=Pseudomonas fulva TaxID=47880 RepID=UPI0018AC011C|nr:hypothetical protein [Pseudomonas fulva]MBF8775617.1 hypothetical protein [Pseudomonas fulva]